MAAVVQNWSSAQAREAATAIVRALRDKGFTAYFAGGCVRDELLGFEPVDYDVATDARPEQIQGLFRRTAAVGASFGVVLVKEWGVTVEVATFRSDGPYSDKRRPDHVEFSDPEHDAQRRDFTINALFLDPLAGGTVLRTVRVDPEVGERHGSESRATQSWGTGAIDFVGGLDDLRAGLIRAVGAPEKRLSEDHLRALRAVRFAARYGFEIEGGTAAAILAHATDLAGVSRERIGDELRRMMAHPSRAGAADLLGALGLDLVLLGRRGVGDGGAALRGLPGGDPDDAAGPGGGVTFASCLAALAFDRGEIDSAARIPALVARWRESLCLTNEESGRLRDVVFGVVELESLWQQLPIAQRKRRAASPWFGEAVAVASARDPGRGSSILADAGVLAGDGVGLAPEPMIDGNDLLEMGLAPGPVFARVLEKVYDAQLEGGVRTKAEAAKMAAELGASGGV